MGKKMAAGVGRTRDCHSAICTLVSREMMVAMDISTEQRRLMNTGDFTAALELSCAAGWNQTYEDWHMLLEVAPDGCFGIEADGRLVATTTLLCYEQRL